MNKKYTQKIVGTAVMAIFLLVLTLAGFSYAQAHSTIGKMSHVNGIVTDINGNSITMDTSDSNAITFIVNSRTKYTKNQSQDDIHINSSLNVIIRTSNNIHVAKLIKINQHTGYGHNCHTTHFRRAKFIRRTSQTITVDSHLGHITFHITPSTEFNGISFNKLRKGDILDIKGRGSGIAYMADHITLQK